MPFFNRKNNLAKLKLILDIRSSSVGGSLCTQRENELPMIIYSIRKPVFSNGVINSETFFDQMMKALDVVLDKIEKEGIKQNSDKPSQNFISEIWCAFSSPWYAATIKNIEIKNDKPIQFTQPLLEKILKQQNILGGANKEKAVIERKILSVQMDDYEIADPFEKVAKKIEASFYLSEISQKTKRAVEKRLEDKFNAVDIKFCTHPAVLISSIKRLFRSVEDFIFIDVGGEITELGFYREGKLLELLTVPFGAHNFLREIMSEYSLDLTAAVSRLNLLLDNKLDSQSYENGLAVINRVKQKFISILAEATKNKLSKEVTPSTIFLTSDLEFGELLKGLILSKEVYNQNLKINSEPFLHIVNKNSVHDLYDPAANTQQDPILSLIALFSAISSD
ncbi:MAG TPA: hypothetical protein P5328_00845 [Candidatus Paceibacterota bacterium]|nr:hypothetical protein [Candidatus Paceibacterota bacterium]HRZ34537.1 hypothetical protein [Candidatus Paceibacterota bacterium]